VPTMCQLKTRRKRNTRHGDEPMMETHRQPADPPPPKRHPARRSPAHGVRTRGAQRTATSTSRSGLCSWATPIANKANAPGYHYPLLRLRKFSVFALNSSTCS
jgi:hypothetical protein